MKLSVVIPCYRSELSVADIVARSIHSIEADGRFDYEIICVDDCSPDMTLEVLEKIANDNSRVKVIGLARNFGQHSALMAAFNHVTGDIIVCIDDDGQNPPERMFELVDKLEEGYDLVSARYVDERRPLYRQLGSRFSMFMSVHLIGMPKDIELNSFCAIRRFVIDEVVRYQNAYPFVHGLMLRVTRNVANVVMERNERTSGTSGYTFRKLIALWLNGFTAFSEKPLRIASGLGMLFAVIGFVFGIFFVIRKLINPDIPAGYSSAIASIYFIGGLLMMFIGLIGEYIGRIYICQNKAPQYVIRETMNMDDNRSLPKHLDRISK